MRALLASATPRTLLSRLYDICEGIQTKNKHRSPRTTISTTVPLVVLFRGDPNGLRDTADRREPL